MRRTSWERRRALMIETTEPRHQSSVRRLRRKIPIPTWLKRFPLQKGSTWGVLMLVGMTLFVGLALLSPIFRVKTILVERTSPFADPIMVEEVLQEAFGKANLLFLDERDLRAVLQQKMPELEDIKMGVDWPRTLEVTVGTAHPAYNVFDTESANFSVIAESGVVLALQAVEGLPTIRVTQKEAPILQRQRLFTEEQLQKIRLAEEIVDAELRLSLKATEVLFAANELHLVMQDDMVLWLDISRSIEEQLQKLKSAEQKIQLHRDSFNHIDLRIPEQIFWEAR